MTFINGLKKLDFEPFPMDDIKTAFDKLNFSNIWEQVGNIWANVDGIGSFFTAVGASFSGLWDSIVQIGQMIYYMVRFAVVSMSWFIQVLIQVISFTGQYIFMN